MLRSMFLGRVGVARAKPANGERERENKESDLDGKGENERAVDRIERERGGERERESGCYGDRDVERGWLSGGCERLGETTTATERGA